MESAATNVLFDTGRTTRAYANLSALHVKLTTQPMGLAPAAIVAFCYLKLSALRT